VVEKRFATCEIEFAHARSREEGEATFGVGEGEDEGGFGGVEAETARVVTFPGEVVVNGDGGFGGLFLFWLVWWRTRSRNIQASEKASVKM